MGDEWYSLDPTDRPDTGDEVTNTRYDVGGDVFYNVLDDFDQKTDWYRQYDNTQATAWSIFATTLYFIQQIFVKPIALLFNIKSGNVIEVPGDTLGNTFSLKTPIQYNFQIKEPIKFTFGIASVLSGEQDSDD